MSTIVSVIIPTYNRASFISDAIDSVLSQTYQDYEIIVVDDGSTDDTKQVLSKYGNQIHYIYQENQRQGAARNNGIRHSTGNYIAFLDSDDVWLPQKLEWDIACFENESQIGFVYSNVMYISSDGAPLHKRRMKSPTGDVLENIVLENFVVASTAIVKRECFDTVGLFNETREIAGSEDYEMWTRIASQYHFGYVDRSSTKYRVHPMGMMSNPGGMERSMLSALEAILANGEFYPRIAHLKSHAYSNIYTYIAINYYASGDMRKAQEFLRKAISIYPHQIYNRKLVYTFLRTLFGKRLSLGCRQLKRLVQRMLISQHS